MSDIVGRLRATLTDKDNMPRMNSETWLPVGLAREAADEIERLRAALMRIDGINNNPADYNSEINDVVIAALNGTNRRPHPSGD